MRPVTAIRRYIADSPPSSRYRWWLGLSLIVALVLLATVVSGSGHAMSAHARHASHRRRLPVATRRASPRRGAGIVATSWRVVAPATTVPAASPVQAKGDRSFAEAFSSPTNEARMAAAAAVTLPHPAIGAGWPHLPVTSTPEGWATSFVEGLLDIDFARQSRSGLGSWLVAQEAPDLMPGVKPGFVDKALYVSVLHPGLLGSGALVPSPTRWRADAAAKVRWHVGALAVQIAPSWAGLIGAGWQPRDLHAAVEDVSGVLEVTTGTGTGPGATRASRHISLVLQLGSARYHAGFGTVLVEGA